MIDPIEEPPHVLKTIPVLLEDAATRGFAKNFEIREKALFCQESKQSYTDETIHIVEIIQKDGIPGVKPLCFCWKQKTESAASC